MGTRLKLIVLTVLVLLVGNAIITACSAPAAAPTSTAISKPQAAPTTGAPQSAPTTIPATAVAKPNPTATAMPRTYGELRVGAANLAGGAVDPQVTAATAARLLGAAFFDSLVITSPEGMPGPGIAERWEMSPDAKDWTFYIRKGVKFHDGTDLTATDVKFSIDRILAPEGSSTQAGNLRGVVASVEVKDPSTVILHLKKPDPEIWKWLSLMGGAEGFIVPKKYIDEKGVQAFRQMPVGSGPWKVTKYDFNTEIQLEAVPNHWRATPAFQKVILRSVPDVATRVAMLKTGDLDVIQIGAGQVNEVKAAGLGLVAVEGATQSGLVFYPDLENPSSSPIGNVKVRQALTISVNAKEVGDKLFLGAARPMAMLSMASASPYLDKSVLKPEVFDPARAKTLLAEAGLPNGFSIKLYPMATTPWMADLTEAISGYWEKIGVKTTLDVRDSAALRPMVTPKVTADIKGNAVVWPSPPYPYFGMRVSFYSTAFHNNHKNKDLDALIDKTEATVDMTERKKLALQAAQMAKNEYAYNGLLDIDELWATGKNVATWTPIKGFSILAQEFERIQHK